MNRIKKSSKIYASKHKICPCHQASYNEVLLLPTSFIIRDMDRELRALASLPDKERLNMTFWKKLACAGGFEDSGKDAHLLRIRYLILQHWTEVSGSEEVSSALSTLKKN